MIPVSFLYDEYIDRPKLTEQKKKNPVEYIVPPPPSRGVGTIMLETKLKLFPNLNSGRQGTLTKSERQKAFYYQNIAP